MWQFIIAHIFLFTYQYSKYLTKTNWIIKVIPEERKIMI